MTQDVQNTKYVVDKILKHQIQQVYPELNETFIEYAMEYCENHTEEDVLELLQNTSKDIINANIEQTTFSVA